MNISRIKRAAINRSMRFINERRGWTTDRKIIVIESDDWGSIRMPNREVYERALKKGITVDNCSYCKYDTLASVTDFEAIFDIFRKHKDKNGNPPIITTNTIVGNPDFDKIKSDNFKNYFYEPFTETLKRYPNRSFHSWKEGMDERIFYPQLHGREHLNVERWLSALQDNSKEAHFAFKNSFFGISKTISKEGNPSFMAALDYDNDEGKKIGLQSVKEAVSLFEEIFGYNSKSFIAPNYFWDSEIEKELKSQNISYLQGSIVQKTPT